MSNLGPRTTLRCPLTDATYRAIVAAVEARADTGDRLAKERIAELLYTTAARTA